MNSRFRAYCSKPKHAATCHGGGAAKVRLRAGRAFLLFGIAALLLLICIAPMTVAWAATPPGTNIDNTAQVTFRDSPASLDRNVNSNTVTVITEAFRTPALIEFLQYAPTNSSAQDVVVLPTDHSPSGVATGPFVPLSAPVPAGSITPIDLISPVKLITAVQYHMGEPIFIRLTDLDQNLDPAVAETVVVTVSNSVTGDTEVLRLTETGLTTGVFVGYIQSSSVAAVSNNGLLNVVNQSSVLVSYVDVADATDTSATAALVDPFAWSSTALRACR
jgi:hypothetical protein